MERVNAMLKEYLQHYVLVNQENWAELLDAAQFAHNINWSLVVGHSPFEIATGKQPLTPPEVVKRKGNGHFPMAFRFAHDYHAYIEEAHEALEHAAQRMKKYVDQHKRGLEFQVGHLVLLKTNTQMLKTKQAKKWHKGRQVRARGRRASRASAKRHVQAPTLCVSAKHRVWAQDAQAM
ncbi:uncharacterized protein LOC144704949 [Wolffia australiana]